MALMRCWVAVPGECVSRVLSRSPVVPCDGQEVILRRKVVVDQACVPSTRAADEHDELMTLDRHDKARQLVAAQAALKMVVGAMEQRSNRNLGEEQVPARLDTVLCG